MKSAVKAVGTVLLITLFTKLMSLFSNMAYITYFGINLEIDIYSYALQLPNIVFNGLGTAIVTAVIPIFAGYIGINEKEKAVSFANNISGIALVFTGILSVLGIVLAPYILLLTRFQDNGYGLAVSIVRIMFPVMIFFAQNFILQGVLQSLGRYNMPAAVTLPGSIIVILYIFLLGDRYGVKGLTIATFIGLAMQAIILIPAALRAGYNFKPSFDYRSEDVKKAARLVPPILLGTSAYQLNMLFSTTLSANFKDTVAVITTVQNLVLYAILAFIYSVTAVMFPRFTMLAAREDMEGFKKSIFKVLKSVIYFLVPSSAGFIAVRYQLVDFLYGWGKVTASNISTASEILALYALGVTGIGIKEVMDRVFFSLKDTKTPAIAGVTVMAVNVISSLGLVAILGVPGIPLAYSIAATVGAVFLIVFMHKKIKGFGGKKLLFDALKVIMSSVIMFMVVLPVAMALKDAVFFGQAVVDKGIRLFIPVITGLTVYITATRLFNIDEAVETTAWVKHMLLKGIHCSTVSTACGKKETDD